MTDRAVTIPMNYVLLLGVVTLLASGLFVAGGSLVADQRAGAVDAGLSVAGNRLANGVAAVDRLASLDGTDAARTAVVLPRRVAGRTYLVSVDSDPTPGGRYDVTLVLSESGGDATETVTLRTDHPVAAGRVDAGRVVVAYDPGTDTLEVRDG